MLQPEGLEGCSLYCTVPVAVATALSGPQPELRDEGARNLQCVAALPLLLLLLLLWQQGWRRGSGGASSLSAGSKLLRLRTSTGTPVREDP